VTDMLVTCPTTKQRLSTGIHTDAKSLQACWKQVLSIKCPHCKEVHEISVRQAYLQGALDDRAMCRMPLAGV
jgi:hypothetical protein